jgi:GNAT superfamily N-acetyltransferase
MWTIDRKREAAERAPIGRELHRPDTRIISRPGWYQIVTPSAVGYLNEVYLTDIDAADADRAIDEVIADHRARSRPVKWCVGHWTRPTDLRERLLQRGFEARPVRAMACDTDLRIVVPSGVHTVEIGEGDVDAYVDAETRGWGIAQDQVETERRSHRAALAAVPRTAHFFAATIDGVIVATCGVFLRDGYGYLVGSQVHESARGRGIYRALVAVRLAFLRERGMTFAVTHARDATSAPMLEHLGFETLYRYECLYL